MLRSHRKETGAELLRILAGTDAGPAPKFGVAEISHQTFSVPMRDGVCLATDVYLPPRLPAPAIAMRTPYGRAKDSLVGVFMAFARRGYAVIAQDCRGTGDSEPKTWDYYVYEAEDGFDLVAWIQAQTWCNHFLAGCGGSYAGQTQWCMAIHPAMSVIAPEVSGLGVAVNTAQLHMFINAFARSVGRGSSKSELPLAELERQMLDETLGGGYFNEPLEHSLPEALLGGFPQLQSRSQSDRERSFWEMYCASTCAQRAAFLRAVFGVGCVSIFEAEASRRIFGHTISHDRLTLPATVLTELAQSIVAPALLITGWYDWGLNDALATWSLLQAEGQPQVRSQSRLIVTPAAHSAPGYHESSEQQRALRQPYRTEQNVALLLHWYASIAGGSLESWPVITYYLMGANQWRFASEWPPAETRAMMLYLAPKQALVDDPPTIGQACDRFCFDPDQPTPTVGGSILSYVYPAGSVDVSAVQRRADVLTFTTEPLGADLDVVGPIQLVLYASSTALDTDFCARLSDVFPDGRVIQIQSGILRARYRGAIAELLVPGKVYRLEIDMWATANRFLRRHCIRVDVSSADFPRFDRNANRGGEPGPPVGAWQTIYFDRERASHLQLHVLADARSSR